MLNSSEHKVQLLITCKAMKKREIFLALKLSDVVFILLINVKMSIIVGILTFMIRINVHAHFMLSLIGHEFF